MRLSLKKGAHAVLSSAACRKFGASRSFYARCGIPQFPTCVLWSPGAHLIEIRDIPLRHFDFPATQCKIPANAVCEATFTEAFMSDTVANAEASTPLTQVE